MAVLELDKIAIHFGGVQALTDLSFAVEEGEIHGLIGPNGAGKTTSINIVTGLYRQSSGTLNLDGRPFRPQTRRLAGMNIARTFQAPAIFESLNAIENVMTGGYASTRAGLWSGAFRMPWAGREERELRRRAADLIDRVGFPFPSTGPVQSLPVGARRQLELARALMCKPRLLLLDEPAGGLTRAEVDAIGRLLRQVRDEAEGRLSVLLVEHNVPFVFSLCDSVTAMAQGKTLLTGSPAEVRANPDVIRSYLGEGISAQRVEHPPEHDQWPVVLDLQKVSAGYGSEVVLRDVSLSVRQGETVALFGRNGAGKSTLLNTIVGATRVRGGTISWHGHRIDHHTVQSIVHQGIGLVPQDRAVLERQSVEDNLLISTFGLKLNRRQFRERTDEMYERFPSLARRRQSAGASLSGGERQMLAIAKVLIRRPRLLLLDEPSIGLAPTVIEELHHIVARLSREGLSVVVGEQNVSWVVPIATRAYIIDTGQIVLEGAPEKLAESEALTERYLGSA